MDSKCGDPFSQPSIAKPLLPHQLFMPYVKLESLLVVAEVGEEIPYHLSIATSFDVMCFVCKKRFGFQGKISVSGQFLFEVHHEVVGSLWWGKDGIRGTEWLPNPPPQSKAY